MSSTSEPPTLYALLSSLLIPIQILTINLIFLPNGLISAIRHRDFSLSSVRHRWFAAFWTYFAPGSAERGAPAVGTILPPTASGVVLDLGPGQGHWLHFYDASRIEKLIVVEPNREHHDALRKRARDAGLEDVLEVRAEMVQELLFGASTTGTSTGGSATRRTQTGAGSSAGPLGPGSVDCIVTLQVLCSVPEPGEVAATLYALLKRGGHWVFYEHVKSSSSFKVVNAWQALLDYVWPFMLGGCELTRDTVGMLRGVGEWSAFDTLALDDDTGVIPHVAGILVKA